MAKRLVTSKKPSTKNDKLYFFAHSLRWWKRFEDTAKVSMHPWRSMTASDSRRLVPGNIFGKFLFKTILKAEERLPALATQLGAYPGHCSSKKMTKCRFCKNPLTNQNDRLKDAPPSNSF